MKSPNNYTKRLGSSGLPAACGHQHRRAEQPPPAHGRPACAPLCECDGCAHGRPKTEGKGKAKGIAGNSGTSSKRPLSRVSLKLPTLLVACVPWRIAPRDGIWPPGLSFRNTHGSLVAVQRASSFPS